MDIYLSNWKSPNKKGVDTNTQNARAIPDERKEFDKNHNAITATIITDIENVMYLALEDLL